jgi:3-hydroxypropanoate dehydrogenase
VTVTEIRPAEPGATAAPDGHPLALDPAAQRLLFLDARTANAFTDEPVTDEQVRAIYDLVKYAPTSMNTQPLRITLIRSGQARERLLRHLSPGNRGKTAAAPLVTVLTADRLFHNHLPQVFPHRADARDAFSDAGLRERVAGFNGALQVGYFIVGVRAAGLAAGPMTGYDAKALEAEFFPAGDQMLLAVVNIGRPAQNAFHARNPRLDYHQVVNSI